MLGSGSESLVFAYIGLCTFTYAADQQDGKFPWSVSFIMVMFAIIIVGRLITVWSVHFLLQACG